MRETSEARAKPREMNGTYFFKAWTGRSHRHPHEVRVHAKVLPVSTNPETSGNHKLFASLYDVDTGDPLWNGIHADLDPIVAIVNAAREYGLEITSNISKVG